VTTTAAATTAAAATAAAAAVATAVVACTLAVALTAIGCGGAQQPDASAPSNSASATNPSSASPAPPPVADTRTPIQRRRDAACDQLGPKITACAVEDTRADFAAGKIDQATLDRDTAPAIQHKNTEKFQTECKSHAYSSRQVRVLEVCFHEEPRCGPLLDCLGHLSDLPPLPAAKPAH
jgi:hypothetical protein